MRRRSQRPGSELASPAARRLARLRIWLTLLFAAAMALGLAALAVLVLSADSDARLNALEGKMGRRVTGASRLIYYSAAGRMRLDGLRRDDLTTGTPEVRVFAGTGPRPRVVFESRGPHLPLPYPPLAALAQRAATEQRLVAATVSDRRGEQVRLLAGPFYRDPNGGPEGAVVVAASLGPEAAAHDDLALTLALGCGGLLLLASGAGFLLAGRSLRPAARGLAQQEALLADAAHELRTPLASIRALVEAAQLEGADRDEAIARTQVVVARMSATLDSLLRWGRLQAGTEVAELTPLRLDQLVEEALREDGADDVALALAPTVVEGDPTLLRVALRNLVENARRHGGGVDGEPEIEARVDAGGLGVADRGPGPPAELLRDGIRRFRSGDRDGTGIGLSIAARIAELHGGELTLAAREGGGAVARLALPGQPLPEAEESMRGGAERPRGGAGRARLGR